MAKTSSMTIGVPGVEIWINYQQSNLRIQSVEWTIPESGVVIRAQVWDTDVSATEPVYDRTVGGPNTGAQTVPGNNRMVEETEYDGNTMMTLPPNILYKFNVETIG